MEHAMSWFAFPPRFSVAARRAKASKEIAKRRKNGEAIQPVQIEGRKIAVEFWGKAWCKNLESYQDFAYRLDRGRSYVLNASVIDLRIQAGKVKAVVCGTDVYEVTIDIAKLTKPDWAKVKARCAGGISSLMELLRGQLSETVMKQVTDLDHGLFPKPKEIAMRCTCPDWAGLCKHVAATLYGVGHRLDSAPELLFILRGVDHHELIAQAVSAPSTKSRRHKPVIAAKNLGDVFGIDLAPTEARSEQARRQSKSSTPARKVVRRVTK
jgi:uncharacterized Zn finger protein